MSAPADEGSWRTGASMEWHATTELIRACERMIAVLWRRPENGGLSGDEAESFQLSFAPLTELPGAATRMLAILWRRAMDNDLSDDEVLALRHGCMALAILSEGIETVIPFPSWRDE